MKKYFLATAALIATLALGACSNKDGVGISLENGEEKFITSDVKDVTKQEVFEAMVTTHGADALIDLVDYDVLSPLFEVDAEALEAQMSFYRTLMDDFDSWLQTQGFESEETLQHFLELMMLRELAVRDFITIDEEDIRAVYEERYVVNEEEADADIEEETDEEVDADTEKETDEGEDEEEIPTFEDVRDEIEEELITDQMGQDGFVQEALSSFRAEAGFVIVNDFIREQYLLSLQAFEINTADLMGTASNVNDDVIAKIDGVEYTSEQLFEALLPIAGISSAVTLVDLPLLEERFEIDESEITNTINDAKIQAGEQFYPWMRTLGLYTDQDIHNHIKLSLLQRTAFDEKVTVTEERVQEIYDELVAAFNEEVSARHILVEDEDLARDIIAQLQDADDVEATFKELAVEHGTDGTATEELGGDLGSFARGRMVTEFEDAAFDLEIGEFTVEPVETQFGYHVIYRYEPQAFPAFEEVRDQLEAQELEALWTEQRLESILSELRTDVNFRFTNETLQARYEAIITQIRSVLPEFAEENAE